MSYKEVYFNSWTTNNWKYEAQVDLTLTPTDDAGYASLRVKAWMRAIAGDNSAAPWWCWIKINDGQWQHFQVTGGGGHDNKWKSNIYTIQPVEESSDPTTPGVNISLQMEVRGSDENRYSELKTTSMELTRVTLNLISDGSSFCVKSGYEGTTQTADAPGKPTKADTAEEVILTYDKVEEDATLGRLTDTVTRTTSYKFANWNTEEDGSGTAVEWGEAVVLEGDAEGNMYLYAQYTTTTTGSVELPSSTREQYTLQGWSRSQTDIVILPSTYSPDQSETLYAIWAPNGLGGMMKIPGELTLSEGDKIRLVGTKGYVNDAEYTIASASYADGVTTIYLAENQDFPENLTQDASQYQLEIYGAGTYAPDMDFICAKDNRLWGCSNATRTIYASALGYPDEFFDLDTLSTSSWDLVVATPGEFTGCVAMTSGVIFTKQHYIHKVLGTIPAEFALYTYNLDGASYTNGGALINAGGVAMYVAEHGVMVYNGSQQNTFSLELGENKFQNAKACYDGEKYLLSAKMNGESVCYEYDSRYGIWIQRDFGGHVESAVHLKDKDYVLVDGKVYMVNSGLATEGSWEILFKPFIETYDGVRNTSQQFFQKKRYSHLRFRIQLPETSTFVAEVRADGYDWLKVADMHGINDKVIEFPVFTPRCDKIQLRLSGQGRMTLLGIEREYMVGSAR